MGKVSVLAKGMDYVQQANAPPPPPQIELNWVKIKIVKKIHKLLTLSKIVKNCQKLLKIVI